jgi:predicted dehydrogenase
VLGRIVQISIAFNGFSRRWDWQTTRRYMGGNLLNTGPHPVDQALVLFGKGMPDVWCRMDRTRSRPDDPCGTDRSPSGHWDAWSGTTRLDWMPGHALPAPTLALAGDHSRGAPHPNLALTGRLRKEFIHYFE